MDNFEITLTGFDPFEEIISLRKTEFILNMVLALDQPDEIRQQCVDTLVWTKERIGQLK